MSEHGRGGLHDDDAVERLLREAAPDRPSGDDRLAELLRAAGAPGRPEEFTGEAAAMAAFRAARRGASVVQVEAPPRRLAWRRLLTVKVVALVAAVAVGGVAVAAGAGVLPNPLRPAPAASSPAPKPPHVPGSAAPTTTPSSTPGRGTPAKPAANAVGLCTSYLRHPDRADGKAAKSPAFAGLVSAAGGSDRIESYCSDLLAGRGKNGPSAKPGHPHPSRGGRAK
ncbi:hypothetical protein F4553_001495 [Allocatelliglobosispora scoriae]|uniref:Uncharacterized protein n=1 Tax=Allocatelliglobosispora scoriae TaxID=643052 RepID=A0A841BLI6_9ACTN|nr:hypothetical protein [Allocatelliglobosispora scoriae]MBB5868116.1 hypothetical protein [Allocatelliglobosispora scoriae]